MIRGATETDFLECVNISRRAWPEFLERPSIYHLFCKHFNSTSLVYEHEGKMAGFLLGFLSQSHSGILYIHLVVVDPAFQRKGIAGELYREVFSIGKRLGQTAVQLIVNPDNRASIDFHHRMGFTLVEEGPTVLDHGQMASKDYNGPGLNMVRFQKTL